MDRKNKIKSIIPYIIMIGLMIGLRCFIFTPMTVIGDSMKPTLIDGERLIGLKNIEMQRFDIVKIPAPDEEGISYVKRVIGMPGDIIEYKNDELFINGKKYDEPYLDEYKEQLTDGQPLTYDFTLKELFGSEKVPKGKIFVLGDNRRISKDGRIVGMINEKDVMADVKYRLWPLDKFGSVE